jgi:hypothetical protein
MPCSHDTGTVRVLSNLYKPHLGERRRSCRCLSVGGWGPVPAARASHEAALRVPRIGGGGHKRHNQHVLTGLQK